MNQINILVPTDFSENARKAFHYAIKVSEKLNSNIFLLHTYMLPVVNENVSAQEIDKEIVTIGDIAAAQIQSWIREGKQLSPDTSFTNLVKYGFIIDEIIRTIEKKETDLVILGSKGVSGIEAVLFGSVSLDVLEHARCPVIVVPSAAEIKPIKNILYATNFLDEDVSGLNELSVWAKAFDADITALHIASLQAYHSESDLAEFEAKVQNHVQNPRLKFSLVKGKDFIPTMNNAIEIIQPDLLVMLTHKRGPFESMYNPSITQKFLRYTRIPLMVFHAD